MFATLKAAMFAGTLMMIAASAKAADIPSACTYLSGLVDPEAGPTFLASYPTVTAGSLHGVAFLYDNAVASIALIGCGETERARAIDDAIVWALAHDRAWHDGRLRNGYAAGAAKESPIEPVKRWDQETNRWRDDWYQAGSDTGNMAWAMLALLALDRVSPDAKYRDGAVKIGTWVAGHLDTRGAGGFTGGSKSPDSAPVDVTWKSTEHNTDLVAAFTLLARSTHDAVWSERATLAERFVQAMWDNSCGCFAVGTTDDGVTRSAMIALDAQISPLLALPGMAASPYAASLSTTEGHLRVRDGFTYSEAGRGVWTEGTAEVALLQRLEGHTREWTELTALVNAQRRPDGSFYATSPAPLPTGFGDANDPTIQSFYYPIPHLAPAAWAALAERGFNPFLASAGLPDKALPDR